MITLKKITEEGEQFIAIGNTYKQILDQLLDIVNDNVENVKYELLYELDEAGEAKSIKEIKEELDEE
jgi:hypothetical protein